MEAVSHSGERAKAAAICLACLLLGLIQVQNSSANHTTKHRLSPDLTETAASPHFLIHYTSNPANSNRTSREAAELLASNAEKAYSILVDGGVAFGRPTADLDGLVDIYIVEKVSKKANYRGMAVRNNSSKETTSGYIKINASAVQRQSTVAHELFHLLQYSWTAAIGSFMTEATADWGAAQVLSGNPKEPLFGLYPLDCLDGEACAQGRTFIPYRQWAFFQHLSDRYGVAIMRDLFAELKRKANELRQKFGAKTKIDGSTALAALETVLKGNGSSLAKEFGRYMRSAALGNFKLASLNKHKLEASESLTIKKKTKLGQQFRDKRLTLNHLSAKVLKFRIQSPYRELYTRTCQRGKRPKIRVTVRYPQGVETQPLVYQPAIRKPLAVVSHGTAADGVKKTTVAGRLRCGSDSAFGTISERYLPLVILVNDHLSANSQIFHVYADIEYPQG